MTAEPELWSPGTMTADRELWSPGIMTTELMCRNYGSPHALEPVLCNKGGHHDEQPAHRNEEQHPLTATREKPKQQGRHSTTKNTK